MSEQKKKKFSIRKLVYNDKYLIIASIIAAVIIWIATSMNLSPETTKTITVPVKVDFSDSVAEDMGLKCYGAESFTIDVTVNVKRYLAMEISSDDINVTLQTNSVTTTGTHEIPLTVSSSDPSSFSINSYYPLTYSGYFDIPQEQEMEINIDFSSEDYVSNGYVASTPLLSESSVIVSGPKTYMSRVKEVVAPLSITEKISETKSFDIVPKAVDVYGNEVDYCDIKLVGEKLSATLPILKKVDLPLHASFIDVPNSDKNSDIVVKYSVSSVSAGVLEDANITTLELGDISYTKLGVGKNEFKFDLTNIDGVTVLDGTKKATVTVTVPSTYDDKNINVKSSSIEFTGLADGYKATISSVNFSAITVVGQKDDVKDVTADDISMSCDLTVKSGDTLEEGRKTVPVQVSMKTSNGVWIYGTYKATVNITKS